MSDRSGVVWSRNAPDKILRRAKGASIKGRPMDEAIVVD